ncbi:P-loop ATPase, Sll1717 family [Ectothiorhodospira mobilis]|uniref:P-loop ATPase, Sll1717 family n=1 Tax=Ectothiorhodospira mobilis TaxID=195064 RepID=UPI0019060613|nr:hypothetical protein [Ectothiorhodospira mobilis]
MYALSEISNFGAVDADSDDLLLEVFEGHEAFDAVLERSRFLVTGRKGSGKTAIYKKLLSESGPKKFVYGHTFSDYPWHHHDAQARVGIPDYDKFTHSWKYLIYLSLAKIVLNQDDSLPHNDRSMNCMDPIERFVVDTYGSRDPDLTQIFTPTKEMRLRPHFDINLKALKAGVSPEQVPITELPTIVQEVNRNLQNLLLLSVNEENEYFIAFDELDLGFDPENQDYKNRLIGLLLACRDINNAAREAGVKFFAVIFLRDDIYNKLQFEDKNKITENFASLIEWDTPRTNRTLRDLMERRFTLRLGEKEENISWETLFNETQEMTGRQSKYNHITDRTYLRPRDMIKFCNLVLFEYNKRIGDGGLQNDKIDNVDINKARHSYSQYFLNELDDEIHKHVPRYRDYLEVIKAIGAWQFDKNVFLSKFENQGFGGGERSALEVLRALFEFSVLGFYRPGGGGYGGSEYIFKYKEPGTQFDATSSRFRVHPALIEALGLKRTNVVDPPLSG